MYLRSYYSRFKFGPLLSIVALGVLLFGGVIADVVSAKALKSGYPLPGVPTSFNVQSGDFVDQISLSWQEPAYATFYEIWRAPSESGPFNLDTTVNAPLKYATDAFLNCNETWYYRIRAGSACGYSAFSAVLSGKTAKCPIAVDRCDQVTQFISSDYFEVATTVGLADDYTFSQYPCAATDLIPGANPEAVYGVQTPGACYVDIRSNEAQIYVLKGECGASAECLNTLSWWGGDARNVGIALEPNTPYYVVLESLGPTPYRYDVNFRFFGCGVAEPECPADAEWSQPPAPYGGPDALYAYSSNNEGYDVFNVANPIRHLRWWMGGHDNSFNECGNSTSNFDIELYNAGFGAPAGLNALYTVNAQPQPTGIEFRGYPLYQFDVDFETPLPLQVGWLHIRPNNQPEYCYGGWVYSDQGNGFAISRIEPLTYLSRNLAFCLSSAASRHTADQTGDNIISLSELLRIIQFYNSGGLHCEAGTEDGFAPAAGSTACAAHDSDYNPQDWVISLSELLRVIQFYNSGAYHPCPGQGSEDGFCPGE